MKFKFIIFFFLASNLLYSQNLTDTCISIAKDVYNTTIDYYNFPHRFEKSDYLTAAGVVSITAAATLLDKEIRNFSQNPAHRSNFFDNIMEVDDWYGTEKGIFGIAGLTFLYGAVFHSEKTLKSAIMMGEAAGLATITTHIFKRIIGRERPYATKNQYIFKGLQIMDADFHSLPSGHTTCAFALSTVIAGLTDNDLLKVLAYIPAFATGYARVYHNMHWFSDAVLGGGIGYFTGRFILERNNLKDKVSVSVKQEDDSLMLSFKIFL
jgi:membrane-associated phospholipid phosphatase